MVRPLRKYGGEKGLGGLFEPLRKPGSKNNNPADDSGGPPIKEPGLDSPSLPSEEPDQPWLV
jgi:hypothetical protein